MKGVHYLCLIYNLLFSSSLLFICGFQTNYLRSGSSDNEVTCGMGIHLFVGKPWRGLANCYMRTGNSHMWRSGTESSSSKRCYAKLSQVPITKGAQPGGSVRSHMTSAKLVGEWATGAPLTSDNSKGNGPTGRPRIKAGRHYAGIPLIYPIKYCYINSCGGVVEFGVRR